MRTIVTTHKELQDKVALRVKSALGGDVRMQFSYFGTVEFKGEDGAKDWLVTDHSDEIAFHGPVKFQSFSSGGLQTTVYTNPTWTDVAIAAETLIRSTGDYHHVFVEGITPRGKVGNVTVANIFLGS